MNINIKYKNTDLYIKMLIQYVLKEIINLIFL